MTGTSLDGLDVALAEITGTGLDMTVKFHGLVSKPLGALADQLRHFAEGKPAAPIDYLRAARQLGELHAEAVGELCERHFHPQSPPTPVGGSPKLDFIVAHGQTIWHAPNEKLSWQLFDPWPLVRRLKVPVCYDLRQADLVAGGQGAPISPIADPILYPLADGFVVNLGGVCNVTRWYAKNRDIAGLDLCPCNLLLDGLTRAFFNGVRYDDDGRIARTAAHTPMLVEHIGRAIQLARSDQRSLGREQFGERWIRRLIDEAAEIFSPAVWLASACQQIAVCLDQWVEGAQPTGVVLAGGGVHNRYLVERITATITDTPWVKSSDDLGIPCEAREALAFAVLGALSQDGVPITLPQVTGAANPGRAGAWVYP